jgi:two-component sensor histidine kinase
MRRVAKGVRTKAALNRRRVRCHIVLVQSVAVRLARVVPRRVQFRRRRSLELGPLRGRALELRSRNVQAQSEIADKLRKQVSTLAKFGGRALRTEDIGALLQEATELVSDAIDVELVKVLELLPGGQDLLVRAGVNWRPGVVGHATIPAQGGSAAGHALRTDRPVISEDINTENRFSIPELLREHRVKSTVNVVIRGDNQPFGVLEVDSRKPRRFGHDDIDFLQNYANLLAVAIDRVNTQRDLAESARRQEILVSELQHRINNMLTIIRAVASRTRATSADLHEFAKAFDGRLAAIARTHDLLSRHGTCAVNIRELIMEELSAQGAVEGENIVQNGPDLLIAPRQAQVLSMAFHELATNAVKHGALSVKAGRIEISWEIQVVGNKKVVHIRWREYGVAGTPPSGRRGHGSDVLEKSIPDMLDGHFERLFRHDGIECLIEFISENP